MTRTDSSAFPSFPCAPPCPSLAPLPNSTAWSIPSLPPRHLLPSLPILGASPPSLLSFSWRTACPVIQFPRGLHPPFPTRLYDPPSTASPPPFPHQPGHPYRPLACSLTIRAPRPAARDRHPHAAPLDARTGRPAPDQPLRLPCLSRRLSAPQSLGVGSDHSRPYPPAHASASRALAHSQLTSDHQAST
jgi:hypothetical protein